MKKYLRVGSVKVPIPAVILFAGAIIAVILILTAPSASQDSPTASSLDSLAQTCEGDNQFKCYEKYFEAKTQNTEALAAIEDLKKVYETDSYAKAQCHQLGHVIGRAAYTKYGSLASAYTKGDGFCWSGYYHGITEQAVGDLGADRMKAEANTVCKELAEKERYSFDHYNCVHGLGHGFMTVDNFNLFNALKTCDLLKDNWDRESCYGGVFMENVMVAVRENGKSDYLRPEEPMYPCTAVETTYKQQCYLMQTSYVLQQNGYDFAKAAKLCQDLPDKDFVGTCYQSLGRDASGSTLSDLKQTKENCETALDGVGLEACMLGAVRDIVSYHHSDQQAKEFCNMFGSDLKQRCHQEVSVYYSTF